MALEKTIPANGYAGLQRIASGGQLNAPVPAPMAMQTNPITAGLRLGLVGAAGGMGFAALRRAIRLKAGNKTPIPVVRPILLGALIGSTLGAVGASRMQASNTAAQQPPINTWGGLSDKIHGNMYKQSAIGVGTVLALLFAAMAAHGAGKQTVKAVQAGRAGNKGKAWRHGAAAVGEAALGVPLVGWLGQGGKAAILAARAGKAGKGLLTANRARKLYQGAGAAQRLGRAATIPGTYVMKGRYAWPAIGLGMAAPLEQGGTPARATQTAGRAALQATHAPQAAKAMGGLKSMIGSMFKATPKPQFTAPRI